MTEQNAILAVVISALITAVIRVSPFLVFSSGRKTPELITRLGKLLPPAVIAMLVVFCMKDVSFGSASGFLPELIASAVVVAMHLWRKNTLLSIFTGTAVYMVLVQLVFIA